MQDGSDVAGIVQRPCGYCGREKPVGVSVVSFSQTEGGAERSEGVRADRLAGFDLGETATPDGGDPPVVLSGGGDGLVLGAAKD